jgi:diguanylate cyclase (GGDEF)-like protein
VVGAALEHNTLTGLTDMLRDPVTGLYSRDGFLTVGARRLEEATRTKGSLVLISGAFENLAALRQEFGFGTADRALSDVAGLVTACCRRRDVLGRVGDAQFAVLGVDALPPSAEVMRSRLEKRVSSYNQTRSPWGPIELRTAVVRGARRIRGASGNS